MKKLLLLSLTMLLPILAHADAVEINGIYYNLVSKTKKAEVTSNPNRYSGSIVIPATVDYDGITYDVTSIGSRAFIEDKYVTSVSIPNSVISIGENAFGYCDFTSIIIPNSVTTLDKKAFNNCRKLESITMGTGITSIGEKAFQMCMALDKVIVKDLVAWCQISFNDYPFDWNSGHLYSDENTEITELVIPDGLTTIKKGPFYGCKYLTTLIIPNSVTKIDGGAFSKCEGLTEVKLPNSITCLNGFDNCTGLSSISIPNSVTTIGVGAFSGCTGFTSFEIPNSVTSIESYAFEGSGLKSITIPNNVISIGNGAFSGCSKLTEITIESGVQTIGDRAFGSCQEITDVYSYSEQLPQTNTTAFDNSLIEYATLHVPEAAINSYKTTAPWSGFKEVVAISPSGISKLEASETSVKCEDGQLTVEGINDGQIVDVYSLNGEKLDSAVVKNGTTHIDSKHLSEKAVIVKVNNKSIKLLHK